MAPDESAFPRIGINARGVRIRCPVGTAAELENLLSTRNRAAARLYRGTRAGTVASRTWYRHICRLRSPGGRESIVNLPQCRLYLFVGVVVGGVWLGGPLSAD